MQQLRLFVSVVPSQQVLDDLDAFIEPRRLVSDGPRWTPRHNWHLTLAFMAAVAQRNVPVIEERLAEVARRTPPFELSLAGSGVFPHPDQAAVLWIGVDGDVADLTRLAQRCRTAVGRAGARVDAMAFRPHLTVARWRVPATATKWLRAVGEFHSSTWTVDRFSLVHSQLGHAGPVRHEVVAEFSL